LFEASAASLDFHAAIDAEQRHRDVTAEAATSGATQRHTLGRPAAFLYEADDGALGAVTLLAGSGAAGHRATARA
jgi:hypothetical protein